MHKEGRRLGGNIDNDLEGYIKGLKTSEVKNMHSENYDAIKLLEKVSSDGDFGRRSNQVTYYGSEDKAYGFGSVFLSINLRSDSDFLKGCKESRNAVVSEGLSYGRITSMDAGDHAISISLSPKFDSEVSMFSRQPDFSKMNRRDADNKIISILEGKIESGIDSAISMLKAKAYVFAREISMRGEDIHSKISMNY